MNASNTLMTNSVKSIKIKKKQKPKHLGWTKAGDIFTIIYAEQIEHYSLIQDVAFIEKWLSEQNIAHLERAINVKSTKRGANEII